MLVSSPGIESLVPQSTDHPGYHHGVSIVQARIALTTINLIRMVARTNLHHLFCCEHPENQNRHLQDLANRPPCCYRGFWASRCSRSSAIRSQVSTSACRRISRSKCALNAVVIFVEFDADSENGPATARCERGGLAWTVVKPFAHCRHFSTQIGCRHPDCDRAHVHPPSFVKRMLAPEDVH